MCTTAAVATLSLVTLFACFFPSAFNLNRDLQSEAGMPKVFAGRAAQLGYAQND